MKIKLIHWLHWLPRILSVFFFIFISTYSFLTYYLVYGSEDVFQVMIVYLVPSFLMIATIIVAWTRELVGAIVFPVIGLIYYIILPSSWAVSLPVVICYFLVGALYLTTGYSRKKFIKTAKPSFTVVEFMMVVFVIAILATIGAFTYYNLKFKFNDVRRLADMRQIASALDRFYLDQGRYPDSLPTGLPLVSPSGEVYLPKIPANPTVSTKSTCVNTTYQYIVLGNSYQLIGCLDNSVNEIPAGAVVIGPSGTPAPVSVISGLVGYWKFDENGGNTVYDYSGYLNNGVWHGDGRDRYLPGRDNTGAANFNGVNDYISISSSSLLNTNSLTVTLWMKPEEITGHNYIFEKGNPSQYSISINKGQTTGELEIFLDADRTCGGSNKSYEGGKVLTTGQWYFVAFTFDDQSDEVKIYVDGVLDSAYSYAGCVPLNQGDFLIGRALSNNQGYEYGGMMDDFSFFNRSLSEAEILAIYNASK